MSLFDTLVIQEYIQPPSLKVSNAARACYSQAEYAARDVLVGFGPLGGACIAAEFFLNFGSPLCTMNYEYLKNEHTSAITDSNSCDLRVQLHDIENRADAIPEAPPTK